MIWESVRRPAYETKDRYDDMPPGSTGALEVNYARSRGLLDDSIPNFNPNGTMNWEDAVMWLMRTRNVDDIDDMDREDVPTLLKAHPIVDIHKDLSPAISREELTTLIHEFDEMLRNEVHEASLYGEKWQGKGTAFGEPFDMNAMTAAHRTFPANTLVTVTNVANGKSVTVRINDRGPFVEGRDMDLSLAAFLLIEERSKGIVNVRFDRLGDAYMNPAVPATPTAPKSAAPASCENKAARKYQRRIVRDVHFNRGIPHTFAVGENLHLEANKAFVIRGVRYPDGTFTRMQDFVIPGESFTFTPSMEGEYTFSVGSGKGRLRQMKMKVSSCTNS